MNWVRFSVDRLRGVIRYASSEYNCFDKQMVFEKLSMIIFCTGETLITDISSPGILFLTNVFTVWITGLKFFPAGEAGFVLFYYVINISRDLKNSIPVFNPRAAISYLWKDMGFNCVTFSAKAACFHH